MRIAGRDHIFKLMSPEFVASIFDLRHRYFIGGIPSELGKDKMIYFVAKFRGSQVHQQYELIGEGRVKDAYKLSPTDKDYNFATSNGWTFVVDFEDLRRYSIDIPAVDVFSKSVLKKLTGQRPFGIELSVEESRELKFKLKSLLAAIG